MMTPASFLETCQWFKFPLNGLRAHSKVSPVVGLQPLASGPTCLGMVFPPFLVKQLYLCYSVVISSSVRLGYTARKWEWPLGRIGYSITHRYTLHLWRDFWILETRTCQEVAQLHERYMMMMIVMTQKGYRMLGCHHYFDIKHYQDGRVVSSTPRSHLPQGNSLLLISVAGWVDPRATGWELKE